MVNQAVIQQSRAELFAQETLGKGSEAIKSAVRAHSIVIGIPETLAKSRQGQIGLVTAVNILTRLGALAPKLYLDVPDDAVVLPRVPLLLSGSPLGESLLTFTKELAAMQPGVPERCQVDREQRYDCGLFIGRRTVDVSSAMTIGSEKWLAAVNPKGEEESIDSDGKNTLGTILAATLGSIELVKRLWLPLKDPQVIIEPLTRRTVVSAFDLSINARNPKNPSLPQNHKLGHVSIFGLGAIGSGCNYILGCLPELQMSLDLVDMDVIEPSNEERLFTSSNPKRDIYQPKVIHAQQFICNLNKNIRAFAYRMPFERYVDIARERLGYVWCCLDSPSSRRVLQTELASVLVNGGTDMSRWMLSLHEFDRPENACLFDLYPEPSDKSFDPVQELAQLLGIEPEQIRRIAQQGGRFDARTITAAMQKQQDPDKKKKVADYAGLTFEQAVAHRCSQVSPSQSLPAATISFVSLMPAIFMIADLIKRRLYGWQLRKSEPNIFQFDTFRLPEHATICNIKASTDCLCQSERYLKAFRKRQWLRKRYLNHLFSQPAASYQFEPAPQFRQPQPPPPARASHAKPKSRNPVVHPAGQLRHREPERVHGAILWFIAFIGYLAGMAVSMFLVGMFVQQESNAANTLWFWHLIPLACKVQVCAWAWVKYTAISALPVAVYPLLMLSATNIMMQARALYHGGVGIVTHNAHRHLAAGILTAFFTTTGMPCVFLGTAAFGIVSLRGLWGSCKEISEQACCFVIPWLLLVSCLLFYACLAALAPTLVPTWERCAKVFGVPLKKRK